MATFDYSERGDGVFYLEGSPSVIGQCHINFLKDKVEKTAKGRARLCLHANEDSLVQEMVILLKQDGYIRPHRHWNKPESLHVIEGSADIVLFKDCGEPEACFNCSSTLSESTLFFRISKPIFHTQIVRSTYLVFHETTSGPFKREDTEYADWSPVEEDVKARNDYLVSLEDQISKL